MQMEKITFSEIENSYLYSQYFIESTGITSAERMFATSKLCNEEDMKIHKNRSE